MEKLLFLSIISFIVSQNITFGDGKKFDLDPIFIHAIHQVEASGRLGPIKGDGGKALGPLQIHYSYWLDAKEFDPTINGEYSNCSDLDYSIKVMRAYLNRYVPDAVKNKNYEILARTHNGGWNGRNNKNTVKYWLKVKKIMNENSSKYQYAKF